MQTENLYTPGRIRTVSGKYINILDPDPALFDIDDIAHALSKLDRFGSHLPVFYSVADHCIWCASKAHEEPFTALMHDAAEAYLGDVVKPIKDLPQFAFYKQIEQRFDERLAEKFGFKYPFPAIVKAVDNDALEMEWNQMMLAESVNRPLTHWRTVRAEFLRMFHLLKPR